MSTIAPPPSRSAGYRWVIVWLTIACATALLLSANAVRDYIFVSRLLATQQVRHQLSQTSALVEQYLRRNALSPETVQNALAGNPRGAEAINLRNFDGTLIEHRGSRFPDAAFSTEEEHEAFSQREPLFRTVSTPDGDFVAEVFPLHPPRPPTSASPIPVPGGRILLVLEVALPLSGADASVLTPIRRNLAINLAAALSLLATVLLAGTGLRSYLKGRRLEEQMEIARQVQSRLLPDPAIEITGFALSTEYQPSDQVGGDFYDVFPTNDHGVALVIGDVSGKGVPAALLMGVIHGAVRTAPWQGAATLHEEESTKLNRLLCSHASENRFASMFWCVYDEPLHSLRYVNAGHCPPFLIGKRGGELLTTRLDKGGPVLGLISGAAYEAATVSVSPGDTLVMYSDGLVETTNAQGEEYGDERLTALLHRHVEETPAQLRERILRALASFASSSQAQDDLTFAILKFGMQTPPAHTTSTAEHEAVSIV